MDCDTERSIASSDRLNDDVHISTVAESDVDREPREADDVDAVSDLNQDSHGGTEDAEFDLDDDGEDIFQDDVFDPLTGTRRRRQVYGQALDGERRFREEVYGVELDEGMGRAVGDDLRGAVYGVPWDGEDGRGDAHWQEEENVGAVASSSSSDEVMDPADDIGVVSASGVECKGVEGVDSGTDGLSCPICMNPLSGEGQHVACCLPCGHLYGMSCTKTWLPKKDMGKCPLCKEVCTSVAGRGLYLPQIPVANKKMQEKITILEAKCASLELKVAERSKKKRSGIKRKKQSCVIN